MTSSRPPATPSGTTTRRDTLDLDGQANTDTYTVNTTGSLSPAPSDYVINVLYNRYVASDGHNFGVHVDNAVRGDNLTGLRIRTDLSVTLFLSEPDEYDGGELVVEDLYGSHEIKLPAGDMVIYPASSLHHVQPVTRGVRLASIFWIQSLVRNDDDRQILLDLDIAIHRIRNANPDDPSILSLTGVYHNLLRRWSET